MAKTTQKEEYRKGVLYNLPIEDLQPDPNQPRSFFDEGSMADLTESIKIHGILQPVIFRKEEGKLILVSGERRFQAAKSAGLEKIPAMFNDGNPTEVALLENLLRQDLTAMEEAMAVNKLKKEHQYTDEQLGDIIGKSRSTVTEILSLNRLPEEIMEECRSNINFSRRVLISIAKQETKTKMLAEFNSYKKRLTKDENIGQKVRREINVIHNTTKRISSLKKTIIKNKDQFKGDQTEELKKELTDLRDLLDEILEN